MLLRSHYIPKRSVCCRLCFVKFDFWVAESISETSASSHFVKLSSADTITSDKSPVLLMCACLDAVKITGSSRCFQSADGFGPPAADHLPTPLESRLQDVLNSTRCAKLCLHKTFILMSGLKSTSKCFHIFFVIFHVSTLCWYCVVGWFKVPLAAVVRCFFWHVHTLCPCQTGIHCFAATAQSFLLSTKHKNLLIFNELKEKSTLLKRLVTNICAAFLAQSH